MSLSAAEQYMLELINRARLDPIAEAQRYNLALNTDLDANAISNDAKQVVAPSAVLDRAAEGHSEWMLEADVFSIQALRAARRGTGSKMLAMNLRAHGHGAKIWHGLAVRARWI